MTDNAPKQKPVPQRRGFVSILIFGVFRIVLLSLVAWFLLLLWFSAQWMFSSQADALSQAQTILDVTIHFIASSPIGLGKLLQAKLQQIEQFLQLLTVNVYWLQVTYLQSAIKLFLVCSEIVMARLISYVLTLPFILLVGLISVMDGLVGRDIRKFTGSRESTLVFHRLKHLLGFVFFIPLFFYFCCPLALPPLVFLLPHIILLGMTARLTITYFKKYI